MWTKASLKQLLLHWVGLLVRQTTPFLQVTGLCQSVSLTAQLSTRSMTWPLPWRIPASLPHLSSGECTWTLVKGWVGLLWPSKMLIPQAKREWMWVDPLHSNPSISTGTIREIEYFRKHSLKTTPQNNPWGPLYLWYPEFNMEKYSAKITGIDRRYISNFFLWNYCLSIMQNIFLLELWFVLKTGWSLNLTVPLTPKQVLQKGVFLIRLCASCPHPIEYHNENIRRYPKLLASPSPTLFRS